MIEERRTRPRGEPPLESGPGRALGVEATLARHLEDLLPLLLADLAVAPRDHEERRYEEKRHGLGREAMLLEVVQVGLVGDPDRLREPGPPRPPLIVLPGPLQELSVPRPDPGLFLLPRLVSESARVIRHPVLLRNSRAGDGSASVRT